jgi:hypothetical protein
LSLTSASASPSLGPRRRAAANEAEAAAPELHRNGAAAAQRGASTSRTFGGTTTDAGSDSETGGAVSPRSAYLQQRLLQARARLRLRQGSVLGRSSARVPGLRGPGGAAALRGTRGAQGWQQQRQAPGAGPGGRPWKGVARDAQLGLYVAAVAIREPAAAAALGASEASFA